MEKMYAGFWVRLFAGLLDLVFLTPVIAILVYTSGISNYQAFGIGDSQQSFSQIIASTHNDFADLIGYAVSIFYVTYFLSGKTQATFGKRLMGIYVAKSDGTRLTKSRAMARSGSALLTSATLGLGFFIVIFSKEKISLHDFICDTRVFHGRKNA